MTIRPALRTSIAAATLVATLGSSAMADSLLVLKADGRADEKVRARVDLAVAKLSGLGTTPATLGDITYSDAAAAVGCMPEEASCRGEVMSMLAVDEIVTVTVTPRPGGFLVLLRRAGKNGASKDQSSIVDDAGLDHLDSLGVMFGAPAPRPAVTSPTTTAVTTTTKPPPGELVGPDRTPPPATPEPTPIAPTPQPAGPNDGGPSDLGTRSNRLHIAGMVGGGALLLVGLACWGSAASTQGEIDDAPTATKDDLAALRDLETRGDNAAALGNVLVISGLVIGGISTVLYFRARGRSDHAARTASRGMHFVPTVNAHGAGLALTFGGGL